MSLFDPVSFSLSEAEAELDAFKRWFRTVGFVREAVIVAEIRKRRHMMCLLGPTGSIAAPNLMCWELGLGGLFRTDLVIGNDAKREFTLVEFEGAGEASLFGKARTRQYRAWSGELEHGFGQLIDWACYQAHNLRDATLRDNFGGEIRRTTYLLICGRDAGIVGQGERERFDFRRTAVSVQGVPAQVLTYDEMVAAMTDNLEIWRG